MNFYTVKMKGPMKEIKSNKLNMTIIELTETEDSNNTRLFLQL